MLYSIVGVMSQFGAPTDYYPDPAPRTTRKTQATQGRVKFSGPVHYHCIEALQARLYGVNNGVFQCLNIIFPGSEYATNLIIANVEILSHDDSYSLSFASDGHEFEEGAWQLGPLLDPPRFLPCPDPMGPHPGNGGEQRRA